MAGSTIERIALNDTAELVRRVDEAAIEAFVEATGDENPLHGDPEFAAATTFRTPIAPGLLTAGLISAVIGTRLPGPGSVYLSQTLKFLRAVQPGDTITARVEVVEILPERNRVRLATRCVNQHGDDVLVGEAWVLPPQSAMADSARVPLAQAA